MHTLQIVVLCCVPDNLELKKTLQRENLQWSNGTLLMVGINPATLTSLWSSSLMSYNNGSTNWPYSHSGNFPLAQGGNSTGVLLGFRFNTF